jgi:hypothetical protein
LSSCPNSYSASPLLVKSSETRPPRRGTSIGLAASPLSDRGGENKEKSSQSIPPHKPKTFIFNSVNTMTCSPPASCLRNLLHSESVSANMTVQEVRSKDHVVRLEPFFRKILVRPPFRPLSAVQKMNLTQIAQPPASTHQIPPW